MSIIKNIYLMMSVIILVCFIIYLTQEYNRNIISEKTKISQTAFKKIYSSIIIMQDLVKDVQLKLLIRKNHSLSPVSIYLTEFELFERVKNTLLYNIRVIHEVNTSFEILGAQVYFNKLENEIKFTVLGLNESQRKTIYKSERYMSNVKLLLISLVQYQHIIRDEQKIYLAEIDSLRKKQNAIVFLLVIFIVTIAVYFVLRVLTLLSHSIKAKALADSELERHKLDLENIIEQRTSDLSQSLTKLELENSERTKAESLLLKAKLDAEIANHQKSEFLNRMSHELRTPMNAILGFSQLLEMDKLNEEHKEYVKEIITAGSHLQGMIDEVLDLSKIESGNIDIKLKDVSLHRIVTECISLVTAQASNRKVNIITDWQGRDYRVVADSLRLKEVILNLLTNAIKYNVVDGTVTVTSKADNNIVTLSVIDTGTGFANDNNSDPFEPFNRMGAEFTDIEGSGIGLSITKKLIELMNGSIGFDSTAGKGSLFWVKLNLSGSNKNITTETTKLTKKVTINKVLKIIYIEDNAANLRLVETIIKKQDNIILLSCDNAEEGLSLIRKEMPNLIIMDINLPGMSGFQALSILQKNKDLKHIPVFALSALATAEDISNGIMAGFKRYLTKPIQISEFLGAINDEFNDSYINFSQGES